MSCHFSQYDETVAEADAANSIFAPHMQAFTNESSLLMACEHFSSIMHANCVFACLQSLLKLPRIHITNCKYLTLEPLAAASQQPNDMARLMTAIDTHPRDIHIRVQPPGELWKESGLLLCAMYTRGWRQLSVECIVSPSEYHPKPSLLPPLQKLTIWEIGTEGEGHLAELLKAVMSVDTLVLGKQGWSEGRELLPELPGGTKLPCRCLEVRQSVGVQEWLQHAERVGGDVVWRLEELNLRLSLGQVRFVASIPDLPLTLHLPLHRAFACMEVNLRIDSVHA